jgi:hypothetical protein
MTRYACEKCARARPFEMPLGEALCGLNRADSKPCKKQGMSGDVGEWRKDFVNELFPVAHERLEKLQVGGTVRSESRTRLFDRALQNGGGAVIEWMGKWSRRMNPFQAMLRQWEASENRRGNSERMNRRTDVVDKAG